MTANRSLFPAIIWELAFIWLIFFIRGNMVIVVIRYWHLCLSQVARGNVSVGLVVEGQGPQVHLGIQDPQGYLELKA